MTTIKTDPPVVAAHHLACLLGCSTNSLSRYVVAGLVPPPDARANGNAKLWKTSTIRRWRPDVAEAVAELVSRKPIPLNTTA